jgi:polysaccharide biosynthesis/export protein
MIINNNLIRAASTGLLALSLAACTNSGPRTSNIINTAHTTVARQVTERYAVIETDRAVAQIASRALVRAPVFFPDTGPTGVVIGAGDVLQITIVSTRTDGFVDFTGGALAPIATTVLPAQTVGDAGTVSVPPLGRINARGQTIPAFENMLRQQLSEVLVEPSVIVQMVDRRSARATMLGQVRQPGATPLNEVDTRLVDLIAAAGGTLRRPEDLQVTLSRRGQTRTIPLDTLFAQPRFNIHTLPGDVISIEPPDRKLVVLGAGGANATVRFDEPVVTLTDALGRIGGFEGRRGDRRGVFLYREVPSEVVARFGVDVTGFVGPTVPTIFRFDFREPSILFVTQEFTVADGDVLYLADNINEEISSVVAAFNPFFPQPRRLVERELNISD